MKKYIAASGIGVVLALSTFVSVSAHVPDGKASCEAGVVVTGTNYQQEATLNAAIEGGESKTKTFTGTDSLQVDVPQDGVAHNWTASVVSTHGEASKPFSGTITCGEPPVVVGTPGPVTFTDPTCKDNIRDFTKPDNGPEFFYFVDDSFEGDALTLIITAENTDGHVVQTWTHKYPPLKSDAECNPPKDKPNTPKVEEPKAALPDTGAGQNLMLGTIASIMIASGITLIRKFA